MIFRAAFFIGLVAFLAPREPDLGLGRPGGIALPSPAAVLSAIGLSRLGQDCSFCSNDAGAAEPAYNGNGRSLADVKAEITAAIKARHAAR